MQSLRGELSAGLRPLHETFVALIRLFGSKGYATRGLEILAAMEKLNFDIRKAWLVLVGMTFSLISDYYVFKLYVHNDRRCTFNSLKFYVRWCGSYNQRSLLGIII